MTNNTKKQTRSLNEAIQYRNACLKNGWNVIAINSPKYPDKLNKSDGKIPVNKGWEYQRFADEGHTEWLDEIPAQIYGGKPRKNRLPFATNTGLNAAGLYIIDGDSFGDKAEQIIQDIVSRFGETIARYRDNNSFAFVYRADEGIAKQIIGNDADGYHLEILSDGEQLIIDGFHYSGNEIRWLDNSPANVKNSDVPYVSQEQMKQFLSETYTKYNCNFCTIHGMPQISRSKKNNGETRERETTYHDSHETKEYAPLDMRDLEALINDLDNNNVIYYKWLNVISAIKNITAGSDDGYRLADMYSQKSKKYDAKYTLDKWNDNLLRYPESGFLINQIQMQYNGLWRSPSAQENIKKAKERHKGNGMSHGKFHQKDNGLFYGDDETIDAETGEISKLVFVSGKFEYIGRVRDRESNGWGHFIKWIDESKVEHQRVILDRELIAMNNDFFVDLRDGGLKCGLSKQTTELLKKYFNEYKSDIIITTSKKTGWIENSYLLSDGSKYGPANIALESLPKHKNISGTLSEWQSTIGRFSAGNPHIMFSICTALAGPLLDIAGINGGGFHLYGKSQGGKTTALRCGTSVFGMPLGSWRATDNGLEATASQANDNTLFLDEIGQCPAHVKPGEIAYLLANGQQKQRAKITGAARDIATWLLLYLSSGEHDLAAQSNIKLKAGQLVRHIDIPMASIPLRDRHGFGSDRELIDALRHASERHYGAAGRAFIERLAQHRADDAKALESLVSGEIERFLSENVQVDSDSQVKSIAKRFAICAIAGELCIEWNILPWQPGDAWNAIIECFRAAIAARGHTNSTEEQQAIERVREFIQTNQFSRFKKEDEIYDSNIRECAGYIKNNNFCIFPHVFKNEICHGLDHCFVSNQLLSAGFLIKQKGKHLAKKIRINDKNERFICISNSILYESDVDFEANIRTRTKVTASLTICSQSDTVTNIISISDKKSQMEDIRKAIYERANKK